MLRIRQPALPSYITHDVTVAESVVAADVDAANLAFLAQLSDVVFASDAHAAVLTFDGSVAESVIADELLEHITTTGVSIAESASALEALLGGEVFSALASESASASDAAELELVQANDLAALKVTHYGRRRGITRVGPIRFPIGARPIKLTDFDETTNDPANGEWS